MTLWPTQVVLASTSRYRADLLRRVVPDFIEARPDVDESPLDREQPVAVARRLAAAKALAVAPRFAHSLVIGSDQVAELDGAPLGKPGSVADAARQLESCSGRRISFHTAVCVIDTRSGARFEETDLTEVQFRALEQAEIERYLSVDRPLDCAGSFRVEALGISLFERVDSSDPTALIGLPLISVCRLLRRAGWVVP